MPGAAQPLFAPAQLCFFAYLDAYGGLRGDPYLWREMRQHFEGVGCPTTSEGLTSVIEEAFKELTGFPLSHADPIYVEKYSHGGMSSGYVDPKFWRETAVPLLQSRLGANARSAS